MSELRESLHVCIHSWDQWERWACGLITVCARSHNRHGQKLTKNTNKLHDLLWLRVKPKWVTWISTTEWFSCISCQQERGSYVMCKDDVSCQCIYWQQQWRKIIKGTDKGQNKLTDWLIVVWKKIKTQRLNHSSHFRISHFIQLR